MDLTDDGTPKSPAAPPPTPPTQTLRVTPDNVVELGALFSDAEAILQAKVSNLKQDLQLPGPWLGDPVSKKVWEFFNNYFVKDENSFANVLEAAYNQHRAHAQTLIDAAKLYGKTDELNAARNMQQLPG